MLGQPNENRFDLPVASKVCLECIIQNYFYHYAGSRFADYTFGYLSYESLKKTDFRVPYLSPCGAKIDLVAAPEGHVVAGPD